MEDIYIYNIIFYCLLTCILFYLLNTIMIFINLKKIKDIDIIFYKSTYEFRGIDTFKY